MNTSRSPPSPVTRTDIKGSSVLRKQIKETKLAVPGESPPLSTHHTSTIAAATQKSHNIKREEVSVSQDLPKSFDLTIRIYSETAPLETKNDLRRIRRSRSTGLFLSLERQHSTIKEMIRTPSQRRRHADREQGSTDVFSNDASPAVSDHSARVNRKRSQAEVIEDTARRGSAWASNHAKMGTASVNDKEFRRASKLDHRMRRG